MMSSAIRILAYLCAITACLGARPSAADTPIPVYLWLGQSNAGDGGFVPGGLEPELQLPQDSLLQYLQHLNAQETVETADWEPLKPRLGTWFGGELSFGQAMQRRLGQPIAVLRVSASGSALATHWVPSEQIWYPMMIAKATSALAQLESSGYAPQLAGAIWIQGETDAYNNNWAAAYDENLLELVAAMRTDLASPNLPFFYNELHIRSDEPYVERVRQSQREAQQLADNMMLLNIDDLPLNADSIHFPGSTHVEVGRRFADLVAPSADFNHDGTIDGLDLTSWSQSWGVDRKGDANSDGLTDGNDFLLWQRQLSASSPPFQNVPEPASFILAVGMLGAARVYGIYRSLKA
jgi:hypothetical protein